MTGFFEGLVVKELASNVGGREFKSELYQTQKVAYQISQCKKAGTAGSTFGLVGRYGICIL